MKKILFILLLVPSICFGQSIGKYRYQIIRQTYFGDTIDYEIGTDTAKVSTNLDFINFNKPILVDKNAIPLRQEFLDSVSDLRNLISGGVISGDFLKQSSGTLIPYADVGEAPVGALYYHNSGYNLGIKIDTSWTASSVGYIGIEGLSVSNIGIYGQSTNNEGIFGYSTNSTGIKGQSVNELGGLFLSTNYTSLYSYTTNGYNHALFGNTGDSLTIRSDATLHQYYGGNEVFYTNTLGELYSDAEGDIFSTQGAKVRMNNIYMFSASESNEGFLQNLRNNTWQGMFCFPDDSTLRFGRNKNDTYPISDDYFLIHHNGIFSQWHSGIEKLATDTTGNLTLAGDLSYAFSHGSAVTTVATYTPALDVNVPKKIEATITATYEDYITIDGDSITITRNGDYWFRIYGNISSTANDDFRIQIAKNAVLVDSYNYWQGSTNGASNYSPIAFEWYMANLIIGDDVSFWITNNTNSNDPVIRNFKIIVTKSPE